MSASLFEVLQSLVGPSVARVASSALDEHEYGVGKTLDAAFAAILCGLERNAGDANVMGEVAKLIGDRSNDTAILANAGGLLSSEAYASSTALGERLLTTLFGARTGVITAAVARASGVGSRCAATLLPVAGSLVLATLGKKFGAAVPATTAIAGAINGERNSLSRVVPPYLRKLIGSVPEGGTKALTGAMTGAGLSSLAWLVLPLALLLAVVWFLLVPESGTDDTRTASQSPARPADKSTRPRDSATRPATRPRETADWSFDTSPARKTAPEQPSSSSSTWTAPTSTPSSSSAAARKGPPLPGLIRLTLGNGTEIDVVPNVGLEPKLVAFIDDKYSVVDKTRWFDFDRIRFLTGSSELTPGSKVQLRNTATILKSYPKVNIKIGGYTDNVGDPDANLKLSDDRAKSVMAELIKLGIAAERLEAEGYGDQHPTADNATPEGRAKNRRTAVSVRAK